jgi:Ring finger domain
MSMNCNYDSANKDPVLGSSPSDSNSIPEDMRITHQSTQTNQEKTSNIITNHNLRNLRNNNSVRRGYTNDSNLCQSRSTNSPHNITIVNHNNISQSPNSADSMSPLRREHTNVSNASQYTNQTDIHNNLNMDYMNELQSNDVSANIPMSSVMNRNSTTRIVDYPLSHIHNIYYVDGAVLENCSLGNATNNDMATWDSDRRSIRDRVMRQAQSSSRNFVNFRGRTVSSEASIACENARNAIRAADSTANSGSSQESADNVHVQVLSNDEISNTDNNSESSANSQPDDTQRRSWLISSSGVTALLFRMDPTTNGVTIISLDRNPNMGEATSRSEIMDIPFLFQNFNANRQMNENDVNNFSGFIKKYKQLKKMKILLSSIKCYTYSSEMLPKECSICLEAFLAKKKIRVLKCQHEFHKSCIDRWFNKGEDISCPICRKNPFEDSSK